MQKLTPESFGATQASRIHNLVAAYSKPMRVELLTGVIDALDHLNAKMAAEMDPQEDNQSAKAQPESVVSPDDSGIPAAAPLSESSVPGAEVTTAPDEPGVVAPGA